MANIAFNPCKLFPIALNDHIIFAFYNTYEDLPSEKYFITFILIIYYDFEGKIDICFTIPGFNITD